MSYTSRVLEAQDGLVERLVGLANWCASEKLFGAADETYYQILELEPDDASARKALKFRKRKGVWIQSASYRIPKNQKKAAIEELDARREKVLGRYKERIFEINTEYAEEASLQTRERTLLHLVRMMPEDAVVRLAVGETLLDGKWVLVETESTLRRRRVILDLAKACLATAPEGKSVKPNPQERALELHWTLIVSTPYLRVAGTGSEEEVRTVVKSTLAAAEFFRSMLGTETLPPVGFGIYLLADSNDKRQFLDNHPRIRDADRAYFESLLGAGIPGTGKTAEWAETEVARLEHSVRQTVGAMLREDFGLDWNQGWAWEGIATYLTYRIVGTRLIYTAANTRYAVDEEIAKTQARLQKRLLTADSNWIVEAQLFFEERSPPKLNFLMGRAVNSMSVQDRLWSYVFSTYLIEGWPDRATKFLTQIGKGVNPHEASRAVFGVELGGLERRVRRWVKEVNELEGVVTFDD